MWGVVEMLYLLKWELENTGFNVQELDESSVLVTLTNRPLSTLEVQTALDQLFQGIQFTTVAHNGGVIVRL